MGAVTMIRSVREAGRLRRHRRLRKRLVGTAARPRLVVHRSHLHFYAQIVDDQSRRTLVALGTTSPAFQQLSRKGGNVEAATRLGTLLGQAAKAAGITQVAFDRGGYLYHGRVKAFADAARQQGLSF